MKKLAKIIAGIIISPIVGFIIVLLFLAHESSKKKIANYQNGRLV